MSNFSLTSIIQKLEKEGFQQAFAESGDHLNNYYLFTKGQWLALIMLDTVNGKHYLFSLKLDDGSDAKELAILKHQHNEAVALANGLGQSDISNG
jgi:hypothetical protein